MHYLGDREAQEENRRRIAIARAAQAKRAEAAKAAKKAGAAKVAAANAAKAAALAKQRAKTAAQKKAAQNAAKRAAALRAQQLAYEKKVAEAKKQAEFLKPTPPKRKMGENEKSYERRVAAEKKIVAKAKLTAALKNVKLPSFVNEKSRERIIEKAKHDIKKKEDALRIKNAGIINSYNAIMGKAKGFKLAIPKEFAGDPLKVDIAKFKKFVDSEYDKYLELKEKKKQLGVYQKKYVEFVNHAKQNGIPYPAWINSVNKNDPIALEKAINAIDSEFKKVQQAIKANESKKVGASVFDKFSDLITGTRSSFAYGAPTPTTPTRSAKITDVLPKQGPSGNKRLPATTSNDFWDLYMPLISSALILMLPKKKKRRK